jgi:hypothetical protein
MVLSRRAQEFAAEIRNQDWSDAHFRLDRAGHRRENDPNQGTREPLSKAEADAVRTNVMWVTAQVLGYQEGSEAFDPYEFAAACDVRTLTRRGEQDGYITAGLRRNNVSGTMAYAIPGTWQFEADYVVCGQVISGSGPAAGHICRRAFGHQGAHEWVA